MPDDARLHDLIRHAADTLSAVDARSAGDAVAQLARAREQIEAALDEAMALAVTRGHSVRQVAGQAGIAPNSAPPRLARSATLSGYAQAGRVDAAGVARARHDLNTDPDISEKETSTDRPTMRFTRRTSKES